MRSSSVSKKQPIKLFKFNLTKIDDLQEQRDLPITIFELKEYVLRINYCIGIL